MRLASRIVGLVWASIFAVSAFAQEGYGTVKFTVEVTGIHNAPTGEADGFRNTNKKRVFRGEARLKYAGPGFAAPPTGGDDRAATQRSNPLAAMQRARTDIWFSERCSGELEVADSGTYRRIEPYVGMGEVPTSLAAKHVVRPDAPGADGCAFNLTYDPNTQTAQINVDPGPLRIEAVETTNRSSVKTHINPFDWSAVRQFEQDMIKVNGTRTRHSGEWVESQGEPIALSGAKRVSSEVVKTTTKIAWQFTGQLATRPQDDRRGRTPPRGGADPQEEAIAGCLQEQENAGESRPDPIALMECIQKKSGNTP